ncbi:MAG: septation protein SpoVG family protein [Candidatus Omnitrophica bacterium]|nr:septation protein SpoVG family protein [Candidatus Omnitrophota bacterium]
MKITEVRIFRKDDPKNKLRAFVTITLDDSFVIRDIKVIEGHKGLFVAMPSRKLKDSCPKCNHRNEKGSKFCNQCGANIEGVTSREPQSQENDGPENEHKDIAHPITLECREYIQRTVLEVYDKEKLRHETKVEG